MCGVVWLVKRERHMRHVIIMVHRYHIWYHYKRTFEVWSINKYTSQNHKTQPCHQSSHPIHINNIGILASTFRVSSMVLLGFPIRWSGFTQHQRIYLSEWLEFRKIKGICGISCIYSLMAFSNTNVVNLFLGEKNI